MFHRASASIVRRVDFLMPLIAAVLAVVVALTIGAFFLIALGADVTQVYSKLISGALGSTYSLMQTIGKATPLLFVALGVCIAFRGGVLNIGVEGQVIVGGLASTAVALAFPAMPGPLLIVLSLLAGFAAGAVWAGIPGILKAWNGVNEILSTIMMNQVASYLLIVLLTGPMKDVTAEATAANIVQTARIPDQAWLPAIVPRTPFHLGAILAVIAAFLVFFFLWRTVAGYRIRAVGANPKAAAYAGIPVKRITLLAMLLSGGLAGLAGGVEVLGVTHRALQDFTTGYGFSGIVVGLFGSLHPLAAIPASLIFGGLLVSGSKLQSVGVSSAMVTVLQGLIVLCVVGSNELVRRWRQRPRGGTRAPEVETAPIQEPQTQEGFGR